MFFRIENKLQNLKFEKFRKNYLEIDKIEPHYDVCVIGSDEVFNCLASGWWGFSSQLFGNVDEANKVISYAASCGSTKYENIPVSITQKIRESFRKISAFSVRDVNTGDFVKHLCNKEIYFNLDPTLIYSFDSKIKEKKDYKLPSRYCIIYAYQDRINKIEEINAILDFCRKHKLIPLTIGGKQKWCKKHYICTPFECMNAFKYADFVITDTFHGSIFSAKYADKYAIIIRESNVNKLGDLVERIGIENHLINDINDLEKAYNLDVDKNKFYNFIEEERKNTYKYLKENIC